LKRESTKEGIFHLIHKPDLMTQISSQKKEANFFTYIKIKIHTLRAKGGIEGENRKTIKLKEK
jgi:hypothetical protein